MNPNTQTVVLEHKRIKNVISIVLWLSNKRSQWSSSASIKSKLLNIKQLRIFIDFLSDLNLSKALERHQVKMSKLCLNLHPRQTNKFYSSAWFDQVVHVIQMRNEFPVSLISSPVNKLEITQRRFLRAHDTFAFSPWHFIWTAENKVLGEIITWSEPLNHTKVTAKIWC